MALIIPSERPDGEPVPQAYCRVEDLRILNYKEGMSFILRRYYKKGAPKPMDTGEGFTVPYNIDSPDNPFQQAYEWLKTEKFVGVEGVQDA